MVGAAAHVVAGEQHLADADAVAGEGGGVAGDEQALADAGGGLLAGQVLGAAAKAERGEPGGDGTGGDQHDLPLSPLRLLAGTSTRASTRSASRPPAAVVSDEEPTLTTILRASPTACLALATLPSVPSRVAAACAAIYAKWIGWCAPVHLPDRRSVVLRSRSLTICVRQKGCVGCL